MNMKINLDFIKYHNFNTYLYYIARHISNGCGNINKDYFINFVIKNTTYGKKYIISKVNNFLNSNYVKYNINGTIFLNNYNTINTEISNTTLKDSHIINLTYSKKRFNRFRCFTDYLTKLIAEMPFAIGLTTKKVLSDKYQYSSLNCGRSKRTIMNYTGHKSMTAVYNSLKRSGVNKILRFEYITTLNEDTKNIYLNSINPERNKYMVFGTNIFKQLSNYYIPSSISDIKFKYFADHSSVTDENGENSFRVVNDTVISNHVNKHIAKLPGKLAYGNKLFLIRKDRSLRPFSFN